MVVKIEAKRRQKCPHCGSSRLYAHGVCKPREVLHTWSNGRRVYLELHRRRWKCRDCKRTFAEGRELVRSRSRLTRQAEAEALWQLKDRKFSQVRRELGVGYGTLRRLLEREIDEEALGFIQDEDEIYLGIDEHSFRHQELVHTVTEVKQRKVLGILRDDRIATLKKFLSKIPGDKVREVETGRGPVDFKFSHGADFKTHLEIKRSENRKLRQGLRAQLPAYLKSEQVESGFYVIVDFGRTPNLSKLLSQLRQEAASLETELGVRLQLMLVDARPKKSASQLP